MPPVASEVHPESGERQLLPTPAEVQLPVKADPRVDRPKNLDDLAAMHLKPAPADLQRQASYDAQLQVEHLSKRLDEMPSTGGDLDGYLGMLLLSRDLRMRELAAVAIEAGKALLVVEGLELGDIKSEHPTLGFSWGEECVGHRVSVLVVFDEPDLELEELHRAVLTVRDILMEEGVLRFNSLPVEERRKVMAESKSVWRLSGFSKVALGEGADRLKFDENSAYLRYTR